jgi:hypothetical protein
MAVNLREFCMSGASSVLHRHFISERTAAYRLGVMSGKTAWA